MSMPNYDQVTTRHAQETLTTWITRLEAATSRLEDMVGSTIDTSPQPNGVKSISEITPGATPTPSIPPAPPAAATAPPVPKAPVEELPESVEGFDELLSSTIKKYVDASNELGGPVKAQVGLRADCT
jgi:adenylyl cyclase-associated protein